MSTPASESTPSEFDAEPVSRFGEVDSSPVSVTRRVVNLVVSIAVLGAALYGYSFLGERKRPQRSKTPKSPVTIVTTNELRRHDGPVEIDVNGVVVPLRELRLATEVAGRVEEISENVRAGRRVAKGEVLVRLDATEYQLEVDRLQALSKQEAAEVQTVRVSIENTEQLQELAEKQQQIARKETERINALVSQRAASAAEVDVARRAELAADASLLELKNRRRELEAQQVLVSEKRALTEVLLSRAKLDLARCEVRSPIHGRVVSSAVEEQSFLPTGTTFITIEDTSAVEVRTSLTADQMVWIWDSRWESEGGPVEATPVHALIACRLGNQTYRWSAKFERVDGVGIDLNTRTYPCLFRVDLSEFSNDEISRLRLTRGMFVDVLIQTRPNRTLYSVDEAAVRPGNRLWLSVDGQLKIFPVTVVSRDAEQVIVQVPTEFSDLKSFASAKIIVSPISDPVEGMPVASEPTDEKQPSSGLVEHPGASDGLTGKSSSELSPTKPSAKAAG